MYTVYEITNYIMKLNLTYYSYLITNNSFLIIYYVFNFVFLSFGQYIVSTLNTGLSIEFNLKVEEFETRFKTLENIELNNEEKTICLILLRNRCLQLMHSLLFTNKNLVCTG